MAGYHQHELAHSLKLKAGVLPEDLARLGERVLGRGRKRLAVLVEERAEEAQRRQLRERIDKRRRESRHHVQVGGASLDIAEERRPVHTLAAGQYLIKIGTVVYHEIKRLEPAVTSGILEIDVAYALFLDVFD